ncbi:MAG: polyphosphate kinase 2 family protein [Acidimicrobiia bacterium]|nr:polyphosphate kinase 2 family protein [Acidimicrobiia bacterium]
MRADKDLDLARHDPAATFGWDKDGARAALRGDLATVHELQTRLFAEGTRSLLVVLQAMDAGGKDGVLRNVLTGLNPAGVEVTSFGVPTDLELAHDYLWRVHDAGPSRGRIGVFNRSHYEDVLVVRVKHLVPASHWRKRYDHINRFERMLVDEGTAIVKLFLHISSEEQRSRLQDRLDSPDERWKFRLGDLDDRRLWPQYMDAYRDALARTSTAHAPWYVVPGDRKWVRNLAVAHVLRDALEHLDPQYPEPEAGLDGIIVT